MHCVTDLFHALNQNSQNQTSLKKETYFALSFNIVEKEAKKMISHLERGCKFDSTTFLHQFENSHLLLLTSCFSFYAGTY